MYSYSSPKHSVQTFVFGVRRNLLFTLNQIFHVPLNYVEHCFEHQGQPLCVRDGW